MGRFSQTGFFDPAQSEEPNNRMSEIAGHVCHDLLIQSGFATSVAWAESRTAGPKLGGDRAGGGYRFTDIIEITLMTEIQRKRRVCLDPVEHPR